MPSVRWRGVPHWGRDLGGEGRRTVCPAGSWSNASQRNPARQPVGRAVGVADQNAQNVRSISRFRLPQLNHSAGRRTTCNQKPSRHVRASRKSLNPTGFVT
jgi:hypothetical protein